LSAFEWLPGERYYCRKHNEGRQNRRENASHGYSASTSEKMMMRNEKMSLLSALTIWHTTKHKHFCFVIIKFMPLHTTKTFECQLLETKGYKVLNTGKNPEA